MVKRCALSTGNLLRGGLPRNNVDRITDRPDMTSAVYGGRKASTHTNKQNKYETNGYLFYIVDFNFVLYYDNGFKILIFCLVFHSQNFNKFIIANEFTI